MTDLQKKFYDVFTGHKASGRADAYIREGFSPDDVIRITDELISMGLLKKNKAGAISAVRQPGQMTQADARRLLRRH